MKIYFGPFFIQEPVNLATIKEENQEHILFVIRAGEYLTFENPDVLLLVPNDNSTFARQIKEVVNKDETYHVVFATPAENLKIKPNFWKAKNKIYHGLLIKDTSQVEKIVGSNSKPTLEPGQITFKAIKYTEEEKNEWGSWVGKLEVEPFSLGIEGLSPITSLEFRFITKENPRVGSKRTGVKELTESELYKSKLLAESAGKTFTMEFKKLYLGYHGDPTALTFFSNDNYVFGSLSKRKGSNEPEKPNNHKPGNDNPNDYPPQPHANKPESQRDPEALKTVLITGGIIAGLIFLGFIFYYFTKKKKNSPTLSRILN